MRFTLSKLAAFTLTAAQLVGWIASAQGSEAPHAAKATVPNVSGARHALREFDRFLDHRPLLEDELRLHPTLVEDHDYAEKNPELHDFIDENPEVLPGLKTHPRYFIYRALIRQASAPLHYTEVSRLKEVFDQQPDVEHALIRNPESIRDPAFLRAHPLLRDFLVNDPSLNRAFLPRHVFITKTP